MTTDVLSERIKNKTRFCSLGLKQVRRCHRVINAIKQILCFAQITDIDQVCNLCSWVGNGFNKYQFGVLFYRSSDISNVGRIDKRDFNAMGFKRLKNTICVTK